MGIGVSIFVLILYILYLYFTVRKLLIKQIENKLRYMNRDLSSYINNIVFIQDSTNGNTYLFNVENARVTPKGIKFDTEFCLKNNTESIGGYSYFTFNPEIYEMVALSLGNPFRTDYHKAYLAYLIKQPIDLSPFLVVNEEGKLVDRFQ